jgi:hypothetical protein
MKRFIFYQAGTLCNDIVTVKSILQCKVTAVPPCAVVYEKKEKG